MSGEDYSTGEPLKDMKRLKIPGTRVAPKSPTLPISTILMDGDDDAADGRMVGAASKSGGTQFDRVAARRKAAVEEHVRGC